MWRRSKSHARVLARRELPWPPTGAAVAAAHAHCVAIACVREWLGTGRETLPGALLCRAEHPRYVLLGRPVLLASPVSKPPQTLAASPGVLECSRQHAEHHSCSTRGPRSWLSPPRGWLASRTVRLRAALAHGSAVLSDGRHLVSASRGVYYSQTAAPVLRPGWWEYTATTPLASDSNCLHGMRLYQYKFCGMRFHNSTTAEKSCELGTLNADSRVLPCFIATSFVIREAVGQRAALEHGICPTTAGVAGTFPV